MPIGDYSALIKEMPLSRQEGLGNDMEIQPDEMRKYETRLPRS